MARRIVTPQEKARIAEARANTLFARVTARYKVSTRAIIEPQASAELLKRFGLFPGMTCYYWRCPDESLSIIEGGLYATKNVTAIDLLQDDATMFASVNPGDTTLFLHVVDKNDNKRWIPACLLKPS